MMLDLIVSKCAEENFINVEYNCEDLAIMHGREYKIRRLSLKSSTTEVTSGIIDTSLSQVRSFAQFGESKYRPPLSLFKCLRVLTFIFPYKRSTTVDLTAIDQLFQLRYLKVVAFQCIIDLPTKIQGLVHLETLEIAGRWTENFPSDIVSLPRLSRLTLPHGTGLPQGIARIKPLRTLRCYVMEKSSLEDIKGLSELTGMRELGFPGKMEAEAVDALVSSIERLCGLKSLFVHAEPSKHYCEPMFSLSNPPLHIEKLHLLGWPLKRVPNWIGGLHCLSSVYLSTGRLSTDEVRVVEKLPSLVILYLSVSHINDDGPAIICVGLEQVQ